MSSLSPTAYVSSRPSSRHTRRRKSRDTLQHGGKSRAWDPVLVRVGEVTDDSLSPTAESMAHFAPPFFFLLHPRLDVGEEKSFILFLCHGRHMSWLGWGRFAALSQSALMPQLEESRSHLSCFGDPPTPPPNPPPNPCKSLLPSSLSIFLSERHLAYPTSTPLLQLEKI